MQVRFAGPAGVQRNADMRSDAYAPGNVGANASSLSIEELIDAYGDDILRLCLLYLGDRQLAEDAFQITMTKAWRQLSSFRGESGVKTWLSHIAANTCRDAMRSGWFRMRRKSEPLEALFDLAAPQEADGSQVREAVLALPGKYREVVVLYYFEDMKLREIADILRLPINSVSTRLRRARTLLAEQLGEEVDA